MPEMTAPTGTAKPEVGMVTVIPDELKKLARLVVRGFYNKYINFKFLLRRILLFIRESDYL